MANTHKHLASGNDVEAISQDQFDGTFTRRIPSWLVEALTAKDANIEAEWLAKLPDGTFGYYTAEEFHKQFAPLGFQAA